MRSILLVLLLSTISYGQDLRSDVASLAKTHRVTGSEECNSACDYIKASLNALMYEVELQEFTVRDKRTNNVLATKISPLDKVIVVGAHYDSVNCPGADDNASGTACVLELARRLAAKPMRHTVSFQLYSGEEQGLDGSKFYCNNPKWPLKKHMFMLNLDMVGYLNTTRLSEDLPVNEILDPLFAKYSFARKITLRNDPGSDNDSFERRGIPALFLHTGVHANYHRKSDTLEKLNYDGMKLVCDYAYDLILAVDKADVPKYTVTSGVPVVEVPR